MENTTIADDSISHDDRMTWGPFPALVLRRSASGVPLTVIRPQLYVPLLALGLFFYMKK